MIDYEKLLQRACCIACSFLCLREGKQNVYSRRNETKCQKNIWLKVGGVSFEEDAFMKVDYHYRLKKLEIIEGGT